MIRGYENEFVGGVAILLGMGFITCAAVNWNWLYQLRSARFLEAKLGRFGARMVHLMLGLGLIALGLAVAMGYRW